MARALRIGDHVVVILGPFQGRKGIIEEKPWFSSKYHVRLDGESRTMFRKIPDKYLTLDKS